MTNEPAEPNSFKQRAVGALQEWFLWVQPRAEAFGAWLVMRQQAYLEARAMREERKRQRQWERAKRWNWVKLPVAVLLAAAMVDGTEFWWTREEAKMA